MSTESKSYKNSLKKVYIRTFGWPLVNFLQVNQTFPFYRFSEWIELIHRPAVAPWTVALAWLRCWCINRSLGRSFICPPGPAGNCCKASTCNRSGVYYTLPPFAIAQGLRFAPSATLPSSGFVLRTFFIIKRNKEKSFKISSRGNLGFLFLVYLRGSPR